MAFTDLNEHLTEAFGHEVPELALYEDRRNLRYMHVVLQSTPQPRTARRAAVCAAAQKRWVHRNSIARRWRDYVANGRTHCALPGCCNMLVPPWVIRLGTFSATCGKACSKELAALKRALRKVVALAYTLGVG